MILVLVSPRTAELPYAEWLAPVADRLVAVAPAGVTLASRFHAVVRVADYADFGAIRAAAQCLHAERPIQRVLALAEVDVVRAATLREEFGLPGQSAVSAAAYRDKVIMKDCARRAGVPVPKYRAVSSAADVVAFMNAHRGQRVVAKPRGGSGSSGVLILDDPRACSDLDATIRSVPYEVETFVAGDMYHVDGFQVNGRRVVTIPSAYTGQGCLAHWSDSGSGSYTLGRTDWRAHQLTEAAWSVVAALPATPDLAFHAEFFVTPSGDIVLCEIASRVAGTPIPAMLERCIGIDPRALWCGIECGLGVDVLAIQRHAQSVPIVANFGLPPRDGCLRQVPTETPPDVEDLRVLARVGEDWSGERYRQRKSGDFVLTWLVTAQTESEVVRRLASTSQALETALEWEQAA